MAGSTPRVVEGSPHTLPLMLKAALPVLPGVNLLPGIGKRGGALPDLALTRHDLGVDAAHVAAYAARVRLPAQGHPPGDLPAPARLPPAPRDHDRRLVPLPRRRHRAPGERAHPAPPDPGGREAPGDRPGGRAPPARQGSGLRPPHLGALPGRAGLGGDLDVPAPRAAASRRRPPASTCPTPRAAPSSGGCRAIWAGGTPRSRATATRSTSTASPPRRSASPARSRTACGAWRGCSRPWRTGCPTRCGSRSPSGSRSCCRARWRSGWRRPSDGLDLALTSPKDGSPHLVGRAVHL